MERGGPARPAARGPGRPPLTPAPLPALPAPPALPALLPAVFTTAFPAALLAALAAVLLTAGCGPSGHTGSPASSLPPPPPPPPSATAPQDVCARIVAHWAREVLDGSAYGDYQSMGLSNGQYEILRDAVAAARPVRERQGAAAAHDVIARHVREACAERHRTGGPDEGAWR
ncbi:hypothetical protein ACFYQA_07725 [Streptomyces sp. NPDC005774]|uniref:hypothetical protein n=1 Tax=Streptomyces sp. NPDC005774 TaxID=3364728 RepID=UPI0036D15022